MADPKNTGTMPTISVGGPPSGASATSPPVRLADRYELLGLLGIGGMGAVYRARDAELGDVVALKMLRVEFSHDAPMLERFRREVRLARRVTHPNVARTFDIGEHEGAKFLTMELVDGPSLATTLSERGALPPGEAVEIASAMCAGMAAAHAAGVVHRDLKPDNVLIAKDGRVVLTDFGIAGQHLGIEESGARSAVLGTPAYMAPEQLDTKASVDLRADIYALGAVVFEMLAGDRAWAGGSAMEILTTRLREGLPDPRRALANQSAAIVSVVMRCMAVRPADRFSSATEVASALREAMTAPAPGNEASPLDRPQRERDPSLLAPTDKTIAVFPLKNFGPPEDAYLADGLTEDLVDTLSMTPRLRVRPRSVVARLGAREAGIDEIGRELGVQVVVEGSVQRMGTQIRFSARAISTSDGFQIWARRFVGPPGDLLVLCDDAARAIAEALTIEVVASDRQAPADATAIELYLRARHEFRRHWHSSAAAAVELFEQALARAPSDARILAACAVARARMLFLGEGERATLLVRAKELTERAVVIAPELGEAWSALASFRLNVGDAVGAARALREGARRAPNSAPLQDALGRLLLEVGVTEEALVRLDVALKLDPTLIGARTELGRGCALLGDWARADELLEEGIDEPSVPRDAIRVRTALWRNRAVTVASIPDDSYIGQYLDVFASRRLTDEQRAFLRRKPETTPGRLKALFLQRNVELFAFVGDIEAALDAAEAAVAAGLLDLLWIDRCPLFGPLRAEPRWIALRAEVSARAEQIVVALGGSPIEPSSKR